MAEQQLEASRPGAAASRPEINRIPLATYRLQLRSGFGFGQVRDLIHYLRDLGISDLYLSPLFRAREESSHGYDVVDHRSVDPAFGDMRLLNELADEARRLGMGVLLDVVPNHMGINDPGNAWWLDVLENGRNAQFAGYFDIDWDAPTAGLKDKVLLPFLGDPFGTVLERGELQLVYEQGRFSVVYFERRFPLAPSTWTGVLQRALDFLEEVRAESESRIELESIITQLSNLPAADRHDAEAARERYREQQVARRRLSALTSQSQSVRHALELALEEFNGCTDQPRSYDRLEALLDQQWYRLAYWRVATDEINYRRFFDINDLAAICVERREVFDEVHALIAQLIRERRVTGLRIDHPDGLFDPRQYFENLQKLYRACVGPTTSANDRQPGQLYVVAEKITSGDETLPSDWAVCGTTGYDWLNHLNYLLVDPEGLATLRRRWCELTGLEQSAADVIYESKRTILQDAMASELHVLASRLYRIARQNRHSRDFTFASLLRALREIIACFSVYRTYVEPRGWDVSDEDHRRLMSAVRLAKRRNPTMAWSIFDFIASIVLQEFPASLSEEEREQRRDFALKLQQVTGPVAAKGLEDTSFYRYYPLASLNEVGGELDAAPLTADEFHRLMLRRAADWPHSLSATATHDTKRGEDVRARLHALSEMADAWCERVLHWQELNERLLREQDQGGVPSRSEQYLIYQTLVGTWPVQPMDDSQRAEYAQRMAKYIEKALREAKVNTSWLNPDPDYEEAVQGYVADLLNPETSAEFLGELDELVRRVADAGFATSLAQIVLKATVPGVPDFYQGTELWDFSLVDPDNRRPVDYDLRRNWLHELRDEFQNDAMQLCRTLAERWPDPRVKLFVVWRLLQLRGSFPHVMQHGGYLALSSAGREAQHLVRFARTHETGWVLAVVPRHGQRLANDGRETDNHESILRHDWSDTVVRLPAEAPRRWYHVLTNSERIAEPSGPNGELELAVGGVLAPLPVGLLVSERIL